MLRNAETTIRRAAFDDLESGRFIGRGKPRSVLSVSECCFGRRVAGSDSQIDRHALVADDQLVQVADLHL